MLLVFTSPGTWLTEATRPWGPRGLPFESQLKEKVAPCPGESSVFAEPMLEPSTVTVSWAFSL